MNNSKTNYTFYSLGAFYLIFGSFIEQVIYLTNVFLSNNYFDFKLLLSFQFWELLIFRFFIFLIFIILISRRQKIIYFLVMECLFVALSYYITNYDFTNIKLSFSINTIGLGGSFDLIFLLIPTLLLLVIGNIRQMTTQKSNKSINQNAQNQLNSIQGSSLNQIKRGTSKSNQEQIEIFQRILETYQGIVDMKALLNLLEFTDEISLQKWLIQNKLKGYSIVDGRFSVASTGDLTTSIDDLLKSFNNNKKL